MCHPKGVHASGAFWILQILHPEGRQERDSPASRVRCPQGWEVMQEEEDRRACGSVGASISWLAGGPCLTQHLAVP